MTDHDPQRATRRRSRPPQFFNEENTMSTDTYEPVTEPELVVSERPPLREAAEEDPRIRARRHMDEIRRSGAEEAEGVDRFWAPHAPEYFEYEWKMKAVMQKDDAPYQIRMRHAGWKAVPLARHPEMMPAGQSEVIERDGMVLMERPKEYNDEVRARERQKARDQINAKQAQLRGTPEGTLERVRPDISRTYEPLRIPE